MTVKRMDHVGIVVDDLAAAKDFFTELGLDTQGEGSIEGEWAGRVIGLDGVHSDVVYMRTPDGHGQLELIKFHSPRYSGDNGPAPANAPGIRHITFAVDDIDAVLGRLRARGYELVGDLERYEHEWRVCYVRGPGGILVEVGQQIGRPPN